METLNRIVRDADGDVEQLKRRIAELESKLQEEKTSAIGRLAAGVAHDMNNYLTPILAYGNLAKDDLPPDHPMREFMSEIVVAGEKALTLTKTLHALRTSTANPSQIPLNSTIQAAVSATEAASGLTISMDLSPEVNLVLVENGQIEVIVAELLLNARAAMPAGGDVHIVTRVAMPAELEGRAGPYVAMTVRDEGAGMKPEVRQAIFEPYYTTKPKGQGKGLGLAMIYAAVKRVGGFVRCDSELGAGTEFRVYLRPA